MTNLPPDASSCPSRAQTILGLGTPLEGHLIFIVLFVRVVMLSPTSKVTGDALLTEITFPSLETSIVGFTGAVNKKGYNSMKYLPLSTNN